MPRDSATSVRLNASPLENYSGNASNQNTASKQHHSRIEITTKNMIDHMLSEKVWFFKVFIHVIPGTWSISKCCPNSIRIPSWMRNSHCGIFISRHMTAFFILNQSQAASFTQTRALTSAPKIKSCEMTCWKRNQNISRQLAACQLKLLEQCGRSVYPRIHRD